MTQADIGKRYKEAEIRGASSLDCTIMMYDLAIADLHRALEYLADGDIEGRTNALVHCMQVIEQLQLNLQMDTGGEAAQQLYQFYSLARAKALEAQLKSSHKLLEEMASAFQKVREIWAEIRRTGQPEAPANEPWKRVPAEEPAGHSTAWSA
ncbi:MAG: flagellar protein FliS [Acidobacteriota bacterium]|nr:flagellar protein FliS [Acidobacteriota bacterium]